MWTKGEPPVEVDGEYLTITFKKGFYTQFGISSNKKVTYTYFSKSAAAVTSSGIVTGKSKGTALINLKYGSKTQKVKIIVT